MNTFAPPEYQKKSFNCPFCLALTGMQWEELYNQAGDDRGFTTATCHSCNKKSAWTFISKIGFRMVYPAVTDVQPAHPQMPEGIKEGYEEARQIASLSPRSAAALLRLCVEKLCLILTKQEKGEINTMIATLVEQGLSPKIQKALDTVRVIGNQAVHPGVLDLTDGEKYVFPLFRLINLIIEEQIALPGEIDDLFNMLPENKRKGIEERDAKVHAKNAVAK